MSLEKIMDRHLIQLFVAAVRKNDTEYAIKIKEEILSRMEVGEA